MTVCISSLLYSQSGPKMDFYLAKQLALYAEKKADASHMLPMLIEGNISGIKQLVKANSGTFKYSYGTIAAIVIPLGALQAFNESGSVKRMEGAPPRLHVLDDSSNVKNHILEVLNGQSPLPQAYDGKGIVIGFVDSCIDYLHEDFRDSSGTRVKYYWDMNRYTNMYTPSPYGYGQAWNKAQIDASSGIDPNDSASILEAGHGSNVAGIAVGNAKCNGLDIGGCPKADIIMVAYDFNNQTATMLTDAVNYIYKWADSLHEPCVINASLGGDDGSHDDSDLQGEMIDSMILAKQPGRIFVAAAGNSGTPYHVHDSLKTGDTTFTWFLYDAGIGIADIPIFANESDFNNVKFRIRCDKVQTGSYIERDTFTVYFSISHYMDTITKSVFNSHGQRLGVITSYGLTYAKGSYSLEFQITPDSTSYYWGFEATGTGRYDIWDFGSINGVKDTDGLAINPIVYPGIKKYKQPDTLETICSSFQCSPHVITAQTYYNRRTWIGCNGMTQINGNPNLIPGRFVWTSSKGPTRDYVNMKPDIAASGNSTLSAYPTWFYAGSGCTGEDSLGCHAVDGGTSMASPMVASAAGLYLCRYPSATNSHVEYCLIQTAYTDNFTGPASQLPNYNWGYGKLNAFDALTLCAATTDLPVLSLPGGMVKLSAYPNPFSNNSIISYDFSTIKNFGKASIIVYDMMGKPIKTIDLNGSQGTITLNKATLASGLYFYSLMVDGSRLKTAKLEVL